MSEGRVFSGIQSSGRMHLGNYFGAIRHWVNVQATHECIFGVMDLHAITVPQDPIGLRTSTRYIAAALVASGVDVSKSIVFNQSAVHEHAELAWILNCHTPLGWLNRMTQFKEKSGKHKENAVLGLYAYPVLQAADILVYKATHVPVGEDQKQHLELSRDIAGAFNRAYSLDFFPLPEPMILGEATRVMSLRDGTKKMSKSDESEYSRIHIDDDADTIRLKLQKAKSDMIEGISYDIEKRPEASNLLTIYAAVTGMTVKDAAAENASLNFSTFKARLGDALIAHLEPVRDTMQKLLGDTGYIDKILKDGALKASAIAAPTLEQTKDIVGFFRP
ncbi:MAG: tryptophan--tRNA ligase [Rickettsiales bacterium]